MNVAVYMRVGNPNQLSLNQQKVLLENAVKEPYKIYSDEGVSGISKITDRPSGKNLIKDIEAGKIKSLYIKSIDRISRDIAESLTFIKYALNKNVKIISLNDGEITKDNIKLNLMNKFIGEQSKWRKK